MTGPSVIRVLVVDDDDLDFVAIKRLLAKPEGGAVFDAIQASTLAEGFTSLTAHSFDIALVDYFLGPDCGLDLVRRLGGRNAVTPIIVLTGSRDPNVVAEILEAGVANYLSKEYLDGDQLRPLLLSVIQQHRVELDLLQNAGVLIDKSSPIPGLGYFDYQVGSRTVLWSRETYAIWGVIPGEFTPTPENMRALIHPDDRARFNVANESPDAVNELEFRIRTKGGAERIVHTIVSHIRDEHGKLVRLHGIYHDVTAHRRTEERLHRQQRRYQQLFENSDISLLLADCSELVAEIDDIIAVGDDIRARLADEEYFRQKAVPQLRITDANRAAMAMFGIDQKSLLDNHALLPIRELLVRELATGILHKTASVRSECIIETPAGARSVVFSLPVPAGHNDAKSVPISVIDLTDIHNAEIANRANAAKSAFLARMSHELRTPLNGVVANIDLLQGTALTAEQASLVSSARLSADTLLHLIGDILDFSKIEAGKIELERVSLRLPDVLLELDAVFRARSISQNLAFVWRIEGDVPERIEGDPLRLKQVLINLVSNAMRHTNEGGVYLRLSAGPETDGKALLRFDVIDSGTGLDPAKAERLFDPFVQADASTSRTHGGTGLGLAICKSLVDLWDGEIRVDGTPGIGAHFWFTMPAKVLERARPVNAEDISPYFSKVVLSLRSQDRPGEILEGHLHRFRVPFTSVKDTAELLRRCEEAASNGEQAYCYVQESNDGPVPGLAREIAARKAGCTLWLRGDDARSYQRALRAGYPAFQSPGMDVDGQVRSALLTFERHKSGTQQSLGNFGFSGNDSVQDQLSELKESLRILILEDQPMNQLVIERQMSRLGLRHDVAENGVLGLKRTEETKYNLILCDCSMPHMDGFEFTRAVRAREQAAGALRVPIIALTANVFTEDVERCQAAGMDDFLAKPVKLEELAAKVLAWARPGLAAAARLKPAGHAGAGDDGEPIDLAVLPDALGTDDRESLTVAYQLFVSELVKHVRRMETYLINRSPDDLNRTAHGAKGDARNAGAKKLGDLLQELEKAASANDWECANVLYDKIALERTRVIDFIQQRFPGEVEVAAA